MAMLKKLIYGGSSLSFGWLQRHKTTIKLTLADRKIDRKIDRQTDG